MSTLAEARVAYFSMEVALASYIPTYSGGLGVLAGDMLRAAADLRVPMVGVTLVHRHGYLDQDLDAAGAQTERPDPWTPEAWATLLAPRVNLQLEGREVQLRAYAYEVKGAGGRSVWVLLLDTDVPENSEQDRTLTNDLYGGDARYRLMQEAVLGIGGVRMLRALGCNALERFHMNEGHAALLALELVDENARAAGRTDVEKADIDPCRDLGNASLSSALRSSILGLARGQLIAPLRAQNTAARCSSSTFGSETHAAGSRPSRHEQAYERSHVHARLW